MKVERIKNGIFPKFSPEIFGLSKIFLSLQGHPSDRWTADILKERRCSNALSAAHKNLANSIPSLDEAIANVHSGSVYIPLYILTAWASALLILDGRAMREPLCAG